MCLEYWNYQNIQYGQVVLSGGDQLALFLEFYQKYFLGKKGYKCLSLDSRRGYEYIGVVDLIAVKRDKKDADTLNVVLFQVKGGGARVSQQELARLKRSVRKLRVNWNVVEKPGKSVQVWRPLV